MSKVIYISFSRLTDRIARDWHIDYLLAQGARVEYWDIVSLVREEYDDKGTKNPDYLHYLRTYKELEVKLLLPENKDASYIMLVSCGARFLRVFQLLSKHHCRMIYIAQGARPSLSRPTWWKVSNHLQHPLRLLTILFDLAKIRFYRKLKLVKPFDIIFAAGKIMMTNDRYAARIVPINLCDYEHFLKARSKSERVVKGPYAVYLDIYLPYHNDIGIQGLPVIKADSYYRSLNRFFDLVEREHGLKVVIAAHPTADYSADTFQGREMYRLQTAKLVKDAEFVISMHSTSTCYAVLNAKPVIFIYTEDMRTLYKETIMRDIQANADYLLAPLYNIDEISQGRQVVIGDINQKCYEDYKYNFLTSPESENTYTQEIFWREIKQAGG